MAKVVIYTKEPCAYCDRAISFFEEKGIAYEEIDLTGQDDEIQRIKDETGWRTVPIIMINDRLVGGYMDLKALDEEGKLAQLLQD